MCRILKLLTRSSPVKVIKEIPVCCRCESIHRRPCGAAVVVTGTELTTQTGGRKMKCCGRKGERWNEQQHTTSYNVLILGIGALLLVSSPLL